MFVCRLKLLLKLSVAGRQNIADQDQRADVLDGPRAGAVAEEEAAPMDTGEDDRHVFLKKCLPRLPADCVRFSQQRVYSKPSDLVKAMVQALPANRRLNEDQEIFMMRFAEVLDIVYEQEAAEQPPDKRHVYHMLLLGQGGSGKTHIVQNIIFQWSISFGQQIMRQRP